ncbi:minor capsid protein [Clostridium butyricum]|uniref:minor capsid protein n=1 Tax=Clostridium butyricum TaxID=1492 RepID=UPI00325B952D
MKSSRLQKLFAELQVALAEEIYKQYDKVTNKVAKIQKTNRQTILDAVARIILEEEVVDGVLNLSTASKTRLKKELNKLIKEVLRGEYEAESDIITDTLFDVAKDKYYSNCYLYGLGVSYTVKPVTEAVLRQIVNKKIDGKTYSNRIWANKDKVAKQIRVEVDRFLHGKTDINSINSRISSRFNVNWNNSKRLFYTEVAKVQTEANEVWASKHGIKKQMFMATLDLKTSTICRNKDGQVYNYDDSNKPIPPLHPYCRSCLVNVVGDWKPKFRVDNITKERINYKTYQEWYSEQDFKTDKG